MVRIRGWLAWFLFPLLAPGLTGAGLAASPDETLTRQRMLFLAAEKALADHDRIAFQEGLRRLSGYPLHSYLLFADLESRLDQASTREVQRFLADHGDTPHGERLRQAWLTRLARERRWETLAQAFPADTPPSVALLCHHRNALLQLGHRDRALDGVERIWLHGQSRPDACDPVLKAWREAGKLTPALIWGRFRLALEAGQPGLARYVSRYLPADERAWAERWLALYRDPTGVTRVDWDARAHERASLMLEQAWIRFARHDPEAALRQWERHGSRSRLSRDRTDNITRTIALRLVLRTGADSLPHLASLPPEVFDAQLREWHVRAALAGGDWRTVLAVVDAMPEEQAADDAWRYWKARALAELGRQDEALALFTALAGERNFYGFLAADRAGLPYRIGHRAFTAPMERVRALEEQPAFQRAREWLALGRYIDARREWERAIARLDREDLRAATLLAHRWEWHDRAIFAVASIGEFDDMELRFPLAHTRLILDHAARQGINPAWAMAVARQESAFMADARSHAGALGLMQVMPATGRNMAPHARVNLTHPQELMNPEINVPIGTYYLRRNLDRFGGHPILSTAAYNAGAHRVAGWLPEQGALDADVWAELIPFPETRNYVRRVLAYQVIYETRLGLTPTILSSLLPPITPEPELEDARLLHARAWSAENGGRPAVTRVCDAPGYEETPCS